LIAELRLTSNHSAASRREAADSTAPLPAPVQRRAAENAHSVGQQSGAQGPAYDRAENLSGARAARQTRRGNVQEFDHLGFAKIVGLFTDFGGTFSFDPENLAASKLAVTIKTGSLQTNLDNTRPQLHRPDLPYCLRQPSALGRSAEPHRRSAGLRAELYDKHFEFSARQYARTVYITNSAGALSV